jgi:hypothetical protein
MLKISNRIGPFERHNRVSSFIRVVEQRKICHEISEDKIAVCKKTQGLRSGNFSDLNSACSKVSVPVKIFQFHDMHYESERYRDAANGLCILNRPISKLVPRVCPFAS